MSNRTISRKIGLFVLCIFAMLAFGRNIFAQKAVGYYAYWYKWAYPADKIDYKNLTHINHSFISPEKDGSLLIPDSLIYPELIQNAHNAGVKVLISVGGADSATTAAFTEMSSNPDIRTKFVNNLFDFVIQNNYDGVDIDWEFPADEIEKNVLTTLIAEIRQAFSVVNKVMYLTVAVTPNDFYGKYYDYDNFIGNVDWVNLMVYNIHGSWSTHAGHNAPLFMNPNDPDNVGSVDEGFNYLNVVRKVPKEKIVLGVPFFGKEFYASGLFASQTDTVTDLIYSDIYPLLNNPDWDYFWDNVSEVPYLLNKDRTKFVTFDDTTSIRLKCEYVKNKNLAGIMIWALGYDYVNGESQLLKTVGASLGLTTGVEISEHKREIPYEYKLYDNYPNPFNPSTTISYTIPNVETGHAVSVQLKVYDVLGREVATLVNEIQRAGSYTVVFNGQQTNDNGQLSSGIYFYRLTTKEFSETKKMILIK